MKKFLSEAKSKKELLALLRKKAGDKKWKFGYALKSGQVEITNSGKTVKKIGST